MSTMAPSNLVMAVDWPAVGRQSRCSGLGCSVRSTNRLGMRQYCQSLYMWRRVPQSCRDGTAWLRTGRISLFRLSPSTLGSRVADCPLSAPRFCGEPLVRAHGPGDTLSCHACRFPRSLSSPIQGKLGEPACAPVNSAGHHEKVRWESRSAISHQGAAWGSSNKEHHVGGIYDELQNYRSASRTIRAAV